MLFASGMVSYASLIVMALLLAGPMLILNAVAPGALDTIQLTTLLSAGLFLMWLSVQAHRAFTRMRYVESRENDNLSFFYEDISEEETTEEIRRPISAAAH